MALASRADVSAVLVSAEGVEGALVGAGEGALVGAALRALLALQPQLEALLRNTEFKEAAVALGNASEGQDVFGQLQVRNGSFSAPHCPPLSPSFSFSPLHFQIQPLSGLYLMI